MNRSHFLVCEKTSRWAVALRWALADSGHRVQESRSWVDCRRELDPTSPALLALEMRKGNIEEVFQGLADLCWDFPQTRAIVLTQRPLSSYEWALREAGALHVALSPRNLLPVARLVTQFFHQARHPQQSLSETIWVRLPWQGASRRQTTESPPNV